MSQVSPRSPRSPRSLGSPKGPRSPPEKVLKGQVCVRRGRMPVGRRMPHSHHSGSANANFSLVRQVFRRIPIWEKAGQGSIWSGQEGSVKAIYNCQLFSSPPSISKNSDFGKSRVGKHWEWAGGECHSNLYLPTSLVRSPEYSNFEHWKSMYWEWSGVVCQGNL